MELNVQYGSLCVGSAPGFRKKVRMDWGAGRNVRDPYGEELVLWGLISLFLSRSNSCANVNVFAKHEQDETVAEPSQATFRLFFFSA